MNKIPRQSMPEQAPAERIKNFKEVPLGYTRKQAILEAQRCIQCKKAKCIGGCPVEIDIPAFIKLVGEGKFIEAAKKIKETNALPAICGRVCPQEEQCEKVCILGIKQDPVAIGRLERFVADYEREQGEIEIPQINKKSGKRVAVIGAGPAGLTAAGDLVRMGHDVSVFEALHAPGGVLIYGIPEFRLPKAIVKAEVDYVQKLGVKLQLDSVIGKIKSVAELFAEGFQAIFVGTGAGSPNFLKIPGENLAGIYSANEFLTRVNLMKAYLFPEYDTPVVRGKRVAVFGGGNTALDSARVARRLGPEKVYIIYRRSRAEMPARAEEIHHGEEEGIEFLLLTNPLRFGGDEKGWLKTVECQRMELGEPDSSGRRRPIPIPNSQFTIDIDVAIIAIGNSPNPLIPHSLPELKISKWGNIETMTETGETNLPGIFAGGDIASGEGTVINAMGDAKRAARAIDKYLKL